MARLLGAQLHHSTAYHPQSNGSLECFHRRLKGGLKAHLTGPGWMDELPWVLLGIRSTPKEDLQASSAELAYAIPLAVPVEFIPTAGAPQESPSSMLVRLRERIRALAPVPTPRRGVVPSHVPPALADSEYVFLRCDAHRSPLQCPGDLR